MKMSVVAFFLTVKMSICSTEGDVKVTVMDP